MANTTLSFGNTHVMLSFDYNAKMDIGYWLSKRAKTRETKLNNYPQDRFAILFCKDPSRYEPLFTKNQVLEIRKAVDLIYELEKPYSVNAIQIN